MINIENALLKACEFYNVTPANIRHHSRRRNLTLKRHMIIAVIREITGLSHADLGEIFNRDHTTIYYAISKIAMLIKIDQDIADQWLLLLKITKSST